MNWPFIFAAGIVLWLVGTALVALVLVRRDRRTDPVDAQAEALWSSLTCREPEGPAADAYWATLAARLDADPNVQLTSMQARRRDAMEFNPHQCAAWKAIVNDLQESSR